MKYVLLVYGPPRPAEDRREFERLVADAGIHVWSESVQDRTTATSVRVADGGERTVTDGPFAGTPELLGGFHVVDVPDLDVALDWAARCAGSRGGGTVEVRPVAEPG